MKDGKYVGGAYTPNGYLKAPDDCHQLIVDPVAAEVVKTMFQWAAEGDGPEHYCGSIKRGRSPRPKSL